MTDQEWSNLVLNKTLPVRPDWTHIYLAGVKGEQKGKGIELPSQIYTTSTDKVVPEQEILVFPNPVSDQLTISFFIEKNSGGNIELFNATGTKISQIAQNYFIRGWNTLQMDCHNLPEGMYLLRLAFGDQKPVIKKIIRK